MRLVCLALMLSFAFTVQAQNIATVGTTKITVEEFNRRLNEVKKQASNPPTPEQFLEDLIRYEIGVQEAEKMKLQNDPVVRERYRQVLYNSLLEKKLGAQVEAIKITETDLKNYYKNNPELRIAHILIDLKANATPEQRESTRKRAQEILSEVKASKRPFEDLVKLYSDDIPTRESGGDIGYQSRLSLLPSVYEAAVNMKVGEVKGLLETRFGFHIIKLLDRHSYDMADKRQIRASLFDDRRAKLFNDYFDRTRKTYKIEVNREALKSVKN
ncbi:MAG TPA: peptidylprolyl isomerase [Bdellovibrionales bacterium]|nr:peptidylprolyl isomerase [Bdellovibrionales bacterium]